jgi:hypothetical protein
MKLKGKLYFERQYLQSLCLSKGLCPESMKDIYILYQPDKQKEKCGKRYEQTFYKRRYTDGK